MLFNFCVHEKNTQQTWQLEQGNSIAWHYPRRVFPVVFVEGAKQMCSNIYKCTIFACFSAACPADFARSRLQSGGCCGIHARCVSQLKEQLSQGPPCLPIRELIQREPVGHLGRALSNTQRPVFTLLHKGDNAFNPHGWGLVSAVSEHFQHPTPALFQELHISSCEVALKDHKTRASKVLSECLTFWILGCQPG